MLVHDDVHMAHRKLLEPLESEEPTEDSIAVLFSLPANVYEAVLESPHVMLVEKALEKAILHAKRADHPSECDEKPQN